MGLVSRHLKRDEELPLLRTRLLESALSDLTGNPNVLAIYLGGSLGKGNFDTYSDIDLHIIVTPETKKEFIKNKRKRSSTWGNVLYYEESSPTSPVVVTHFDCFIKVDSWYKTLDEVIPSIWLKGLKPLYDPSNILVLLLREANEQIYKVEVEDISFWKTKVFAFLHETYRAVMRNEMYYALSNIDRVRWLIADGWYMEVDKHLDSSYGVWSKVEGARSELQGWQLSLLESWSCSRESREIMKTMASMYPELFRLN
ncbi:nucleotidyltransferase domain-containing protein [Paenisporosarcina sp. NPDC076898]|uniref:nucleotidyltransferase domain-containing protein n=1 Tax=unclassified Paenisporosarcina TaxID=2642018 RepID=UPI003CFE7150